MIANSESLKRLGHTYALFFLLVITSVQNIISMPLAKLLPPLIPLGFAAKEIYILIILFLLTLTILNYAKMASLCRVPLLMVSVIVIYAVFFSPLFNILSMRQVLVIPVFFLAGVFFIGKVDISLLSKLVIFWYSLAVYLGIFERFILYTTDESFFNLIGVKEWSAAKGWGHQVPASWYSNDLLFLTEEKIRRMPGILIGDSVSFGQMLVFPFILSIVYRKYILAFLTMIALVFSLSKGGILASAVALLFFMYERTGRSMKGIIITVGLILSTMFFALVLPILVNYIDSIRLHYNGFTNNISNVLTYPFGNGIGSGGNFAKRFNAHSGAGDAFGFAQAYNIDSYLIAHGESFFGTVVAQFGLLGVLGYIYFPARLLLTPISRNDEFMSSVKYVVLGLFAVGLFSETSFTYVGTGFILTLMALVMGQKKNSSLVRKRWHM